MTTTFQTYGDPYFKEVFSIKDKIYYEFVHHLLRYGRRYCPNYFVRGMNGYILTNFKKKKDLIGIEIGTQEGYNAKTMLSTLPIKTLYCIDPYEDYVEETTVFKRENIVDKSFYSNARDFLSGFKNRVVFVRDYSDNAVSNFEDDSLDFVYIDGNHSYDFVVKDIELYLPKVKHGGILGGHDFGSRHGDVVRAVFEFITKSGYDLHTGRDCDWWVVKE